MTLTRREKIMIITGLIVVSVAAYSVYFIIPFFKDSNDANMRLNDAQSKINILNMQAAGTKLLSDEIATLDSKLKERGAALPTGIDHARILLYLKELAVNKAEKVNIQFSGETAIRNRFQVQSVSMDFRTTYPLLLLLLDNLKQNKLFNNASFLKVDYVPANAAGDTSGTDEPSAPAPVNTAYIIAVHMEMDFYALPLAEGEQLQPPLEPTSTDRINSLFPLK